MKYLLFIILLVAVIITAGCVDGNTVVRLTNTPLPTTIIPSTPPVQSTPSVDPIVHTPTKSDPSTNVEQLVLDLQSDNFETRIIAREGLVRIGPTAIDAISPVLRHRTYYVRFFAADTLRKLSYQPRSSEEKAYYIVGLGEYDIALHQQNFYELVAAGSIAVDPLVLFLKDPNDMKGPDLDTIDALVAIGRPAVPKLIKALDDPVAREPAGIALVFIGDPEGRQAVLNLMDQQGVSLSTYATNYKQIISGDFNNPSYKGKMNILWLGLALETYGTKEMADYYINSGPHLQQFAERWAQAHGYVVRIKGLG